jgi:hypothetical protein
VYQVTLSKGFDCVENSCNGELTCLVGLKLGEKELVIRIYAGVTEILVHLYARFICAGLSKVSSSASQAPRFKSFTPSLWKGTKKEMGKKICAEFLKLFKEDKTIDF